MLQFAASSQSKYFLLTVAPYLENASRCLKNHINLKNFRVAAANICKTSQYLKSSTFTRKCSVEFIIPTSKMNFYWQLSMTVCEVRAGGVCEHFTALRWRPGRGKVEFYNHYFVPHVLWLALKWRMLKLQDLLKQQSLCGHSQGVEVVQVPAVAGPGPGRW